MSKHYHDFSRLSTAKSILNIEFSSKEPYSLVRRGEAMKNVENEESVEEVEIVDLEVTTAEGNEESDVEISDSYGKAFSSISSQSWRDISTNGLVVTAEDSL